MDSHLTPLKDKMNARVTGGHSQIKRTPENLMRNNSTNDLAAIREYEALKIQVRQLETKNRSLNSQIEQLNYQKNYNESKYIQKVNNDEETFSQFHKQKNYQMELLQIKHEEEVSRIKRESEIRLDELCREIKHKDYQLKERDQQIRYLELRIEEIKREYEVLDRELQKSREEQGILSEELTKVDFHNKKLEMIVTELEHQKNEMETEIRVLLDIEAQKTHAINDLETKLRHSEQNQKRLSEKLAVLSENFAELEDHIAIMKEKLLVADAENEDLSRRLNATDLQLRDKERLVLQQNDRETKLRCEIEEHQIRERKRENEVKELMAQNQRLYKDLNINRHRLHEFGIAYGVDI